MQNQEGEQKILEFRKNWSTLGILGITLVLASCARKGENEVSGSLLVYCRAGIRKPMDEIGRLFKQKYGMEVEYNYAGSNTLVSQMEL